MSYEGFTEYLCKNGHYHVVNAHAQERTRKCPDCGEDFEFYHDVDETNGYYEHDPSTFEAVKEIVGFTDVWHEDHHGNRYATKLMQYRPVLDWDDLQEHEGQTEGYNIQTKIPYWPWHNIAEELAAQEAEEAERKLHERYCIVVETRDTIQHVHAIGDVTQEDGVLFEQNGNQNTILVFPTYEAGMELKSKVNEWAIGNNDRAVAAAAHDLLISRVYVARLDIRETDNVVEYVPPTT